MESATKFPSQEQTPEIPRQISRRSGSGAKGELSDAKFRYQLRKRLFAGGLGGAARIEIRRRLLDRQPLAGAVDFPFPRIRRVAAQFGDQGIIVRIEVARHDGVMGRKPKKRES